MFLTSAPTISCVRALVEPDAGIGGGAGGFSGWVPAGAEVAFGQGAALLCRAGRGVHAGCGCAGDDSGGTAFESAGNSAADSGGVLRRASAGAYAGPPLSLWRRDACG